MDEKTEQLRDIFIDVAGSETVTESQESGHGSLTDTDESAVHERLVGIVSQMRERYSFDTGLDDETLAVVVRGFYGDLSEEALAADIGVDASVVRTARLDLHLFRESDIDAAFDVSALRRRLASVADTDGPTDAELATAFDTDREAIAHHRQVVEAQAAARRVSHRFQSAFEDTLAEAGLSTRLTATIQETGLDEATEDIDSLDSDADISL